MRLMIRTRNTRIIRNLSRQSLKANKTRNVFVVIAIALTTILFTSLFTIGTSMLKSMEQSTMRQSGGSAHGSFKYLTTEEFNTIKDHKLIKELGFSVMVGTAENKELMKRPTEIRYATDKEAEFNFAMPTTGRMPVKENEIATDTLVLDKLGIPHELGQIVSLRYSIDGKPYTKNFILSGFWEGDIVNFASQAWVSETFINKNLAEIDQKQMKKRKVSTGLIFADVKFDSSFNIENTMLQILHDSGYTRDELEIGVNWAYASTILSPDLRTILSLTGAILLIIFCGYLIIYNIFYISVTKDTKFYGLLKAIGTTPKQLASLIRKQALLLSLIGIPIGLLLGYILGARLVPFIMENLYVTHIMISVNPIIFIGATLFSLITVFISCHKPAKIAARIPPIEAVKYIDVSIHTKKKHKKTFDGTKVHKMALANLFRSKQKAMIVMISLSLSIILLNSVYTIVSGFDMKKFLSKMMVTDFAIGDAGYFNPHIGYNEQNTVTEEMVKNISRLDGVRRIGAIYFQDSKLSLMGKAKTTFENVYAKVQQADLEQQQMMKEYLKLGKLELHINGLDEFIWDKIKLQKGTFDAKKFATGKYVIVSIPIISERLNRSESYYDIGDTLTFTYTDGTRASYEVMAIGSLPYNLSVRHSHLTNMEVYVPSTEYKKQVKNPVIMTAVFDVTNEYRNRMGKYLENYTQNKEPMLDYESRDKYVNEFIQTQSNYKIVGYLLSFIIALIGIFNYVNLMITSIHARRQELAMLQSIGMTGKQLLTMLICEGLYYALFTIGIVSTAGMLLTYFGVTIVAGQISFFSYHFSLLPVLICTLFLILISVIVPVVCYRNTRKMSIVERLREIG